MKCSWKSQLCKSEFNLYIQHCHSKTKLNVATCFLAEKAMICKMLLLSLAIPTICLFVLVQHREGGRDDKNMNTFSPHLERGQAQQPAALYSTISTRVPTGERKQSHGSSSCIALPKFSFNEINMEDVTHAKVILIYAVTGSGHRQRNLYKLNLSLHIHCRAGHGILPSHAACPPCFSLQSTFA